MVLTDPDRAQLAVRGLCRGLVARGDRDAHRPACAQQRHGLELEPRRVDGHAGAREVEAAQAVRPRQLAAGELPAGEVGRAARAAVAVGEQRARDVGG